MDDAVGVGGVEGRANAGPDVNGELRCESLLLVEERAKRLAVDELHDHGLPALIGHGVVHRHDVRMREAGRCDGFASKSLGHGSIGGEVRFQQFDRHRA